MRRAQALAATLIFMLTCASAHALEPIAVGPTVVKTDAGCDLSFTLAAPNDVTVRIVDAEGRIVRHLAAGMVGLERAATPFKPNALAQTLTWDGKDDRGNAAPANCKATVAVGMRAGFDKFILWEPNAFVPNGQDLVVAGPDDTWYLCESRGTYCRSIVRVLSGKGEFVRQLWPYSLNQPGVGDFLQKPHPVQCERDERGYEAQGIADWHGNVVPFSVCHDLTFFFHSNYSAAVITTDGYLVAAPGYAGRVRTSLWRLSPEGFPEAKNWMVSWHPTSYPEAKDVAPRQKALWQSGRSGGWKLAAGRDGDFYLADGIHNVVAHFRAKDFAPINFTWSGAKKLETPRNYIGELNTPGDDGDHFNFSFEKREPFGITLDADGNLLVLDGGVVKTYDAEGRFIGSEPRAESNYDRVHVPLRDGGLTWDNIRRAGKASGLPDTLLAAARKERALSFPGFLRVDSTGRLYLSEERGERTVSDVDGRTLVRVGLGGAAIGYGCMAVDSEDNLYVAVQKGYNGYGRLLRFSPDGKPLKFGEVDAIDTNGLGKTVQIRGVFVARSGDIYLTLKIEGNAPSVYVYAADGALKKAGLATGSAMNDVVVDRAGNLYFIEGVDSFKGVPAHMTWPPKYLAREEAERMGGAAPFKTMSDDGKTADVQIIRRASLSGRLVKISPAGGPLDGEGMLWSFAGVSGICPESGKPERESAAQICLDADERLWVPDPLMYCVSAVDRAGNLIARVGTYGNEDAKGGGGDRKLAGTNIVVDPEIPLARPSGMAVHGDRLFISDMFAHRVLRCKIGYAQTRETQIP